MDIIFGPVLLLAYCSYQQLLTTYVNNVFIVFFLIFTHLNIVSFTFVLAVTDTGHPQCYENRPVSPSAPID